MARAISKILFILGSYNFLAYLECFRSYAWSKGHSDPDLSSVYSNQKGRLCPTNYFLPPGFKKLSTPLLMHTNLCILIEISVKMRMANNFEGNDCVLCRGLGEPLVLCNERWIPVYQDTDIKTWKHFSLTQKIHDKNVLNFIRPDKINTFFLNISRSDKTDINDTLKNVFGGWAMVQSEKHIF